MANLFTDHPASVGETYGQHLRFATNVGLKMTLAGLACMVHGLLPFCFVTTGSRAITGLHDRLVAGRRRVSSTLVAAE